MQPKRIRSRPGPAATGAVATICVGLAATAACAETDPLPSWNAGAPKQAIVDFVARVTKEGGTDYVPPAERIAVFDNDGKLDKALDEATAKGWTVVDMKTDWNTVFPSQP